MSRWRRVGLTLALGALGVFALRAFVGDVYAVRSGSMEPCLHGGQDGEWVLVRFGLGRDPKRFDLVVFERPGEPAPIVKRVLGLPGESLQLVEGDLWIDGRRLPPEVPRPPWVLLFDSDRQALSAWFDYKPEPFGPWRRGWASPGDGLPPPPPPPAGPGESWRLEALGLLPGDNTGLMFFDQEASTGYLDGSGRSVAQPIEASDLALEVSVCVVMLARRGELRLRLLEKGDFFQARLCLNAEGPVEVLIEREPGAEGQLADLLARAELPRETFGPLPSLPDPTGVGAPELSGPPLGPWVRLTFENRDDHLRLLLDGRELLGADYDQNRAYPGILPPGRQSVGPRAAFGGAGLQAAFRGVRLWRDAQWLSSSVHGPHGSASRLTLGPDEFFVAGDNSFDSTDSRYFGPIPRRSLLGRPLAVCWPPSRWRWL